MAILRHSCSPVEDGILHNTPALHHSSTPFKNHATAEPSLSDLAPLSCAGQRSRGLVRGEDHVFKSE